MTTKQLNSIEIAEIFFFLKQNKVCYYDVQLEMVDHFASTMEENWESYPNNWSLAQKILSVYNEIGSEGFKKIIGDKAAAVHKRTNKFAFNLLKDAIKIPQIIVTFAFIIFLHEAFIHSDNPIQVFKTGLVLPVIILMIGSFLIYGGYFFAFKKRILALEQSFSFYMLLPNILLCPTYLVDKTNFSFSDEIYFLFSVMIFIQIIYCTGMLLVLRKIFLESRNRYENLSKV